MGRKRRDSTTKDDGARPLDAAAPQTYVLLSEFERVLSEQDAAWCKLYDEQMAERQAEFEMAIGVAEDLLEYLKTAVPILRADKAKHVATIRGLEERLSSIRKGGRPPNSTESPTVTSQRVQKRVKEIRSIRARDEDIKIGGARQETQDYTSGAR